MNSSQNVANFYHYFLGVLVAFHIIKQFYLDLIESCFY